MPSFHITEPHPTVKSPYVCSGRGGAGNITRVKPTDLTNGPTASGPASRARLTPPPSSSFFASGRGGAGNMYRECERAMFSFDEELQQQERMRTLQAPVYHIGRGGAGNLIHDAAVMGGKKKARSQRLGSASSASSVASSAASSSGGEEEEKHGAVNRRNTSVEGVWHRLSRGFSNSSSSS